MRRLLELIRHVRAGLRRNRLDDELRDEIDAHIALRHQQLIAEGLFGIEVGLLRGNAE